MCKIINVQMYLSTVKLALNVAVKSELFGRNVFIEGFLMDQPRPNAIKCYHPCVHAVHIKMSLH